MERTTEEKKILALAAVENVDPDDAERWIDAGDYLVLTDEEADEMAGEYVNDTLWAFSPCFLSGETGIEEEVFQAIQDNGKCESNNDAILSIVKGTCGLQSFIDSAISVDGRGHFIASYDGEEQEQDIDGETFFIYRVN